MFELLLRLLPTVRDPRAVNKDFLKIANRANRCEQVRTLFGDSAYCIGPIARRSKNRVSIYRYEGKNSC